MIEIQDGSASLAKTGNKDISKPAHPMTVGELELKLLARYPKGDAEPWDRTGLLVGDPAALVTGVAVALDATREAVLAASEAGANVLLTHHPVFLEPPAVVSPSYSAATAPGVVVWTAVERGVALMNFHTALDVSADAAKLFAELLSFDFKGVLVPAAAGSGKGYGHLCAPRASEGTFRLSHLAARCTSVFGRPPRVWGDQSREVKSLVFANGSASDVVGACRPAAVDCLVCGEIRYHAALDASQSGLAIVEVGHDASELPLTALLARAAIEAGVPSGSVSVIDQSSNWAAQDSTRI